MISPHRQQLQVPCKAHKYGRHDVKITAGTLTESRDPTLHHMYLYESSSSHPLTEGSPCPHPTPDSPLPGISGIFGEVVISSNPSVSLLLNSEIAPLLTPDSSTAFQKRSSRVFPKRPGFR